MRARRGRWRAGLVQVTARCSCEYEWGVHVAVYARRANLTADQLRSIRHGGPKDPCWSPRDRLVLAAVDALHDTGTIGDKLWARLDEAFSHAQLLDLLLLAGWYHAVSYAANAARVEREEWAPRFDGMSDCAKWVEP